VPILNFSRRNFPTLGKVLKLLESTASISPLVAAVNVVVPVELSDMDDLSSRIVLIPKKEGIPKLFFNTRKKISLPDNYQCMSHQKHSPWSYISDIHSGQNVKRKYNKRNKYEEKKFSLNKEGVVSFTQFPTNNDQSDHQHNNSLKLERGK
jgi:hypothetical protein